jgi:adenosylhomocysteine nucleosidase
MSELYPEVVVVSAMREELSAFVRATTKCVPLGVPEIDLRRAVFRGHNVLLLSTGMGAGRMERAMDRLLRIFSPRRLALVGVAGALTPGLAVGDVVVAERVLDLEPRQPTPSEEITTYVPRLSSAEKHALEKGRVRFGSCATQGRIALSTNDKTMLVRHFQLQAPATVDLESAAFARVASQTELPWIVIRAVSDIATENLPEFFAKCEDAEGGIAQKRVIWQALRRPWLWPQLITLQQRLNLCASQLSATLSLYLNTI